MRLVHCTSTFPTTGSRSVVMYNEGLRSLNYTRSRTKGKDVHARYAHGVHARADDAPLTEEDIRDAIEGVPDRDMAVYGVPPAQRHVVVLEAFSHDAISAVTHSFMKYVGSTTTTTYWMRGADRVT